MDNALKGLFGGGTSSGSGANAQDQRAQAQDFIQRVTTGDQTQGYTDDEAHAAVQHVLNNAPPDVMNRALQQSVNNLSEEQRGQFAQMLQQRQAQGRTSGTAGVSGGPVIQQSSGGGSPSSGGELGNILGGLMGGSGGLLGGLLGGGGSGSQTSSQTGATNSNSGGLFGSVGDLMSTSVGKGVMAGAAAFALHELLNR